MFFVMDLSFRNHCAKSLRTTANRETAQIAAGPVLSSKLSMEGKGSHLRASNVLLVEEGEVAANRPFKLIPLPLKFSMIRSMCPFRRVP